MYQLIDFIARNIFHQQFECISDQIRNVKNQQNLWMKWAHNPAHSHVFTAMEKEPRVTLNYRHTRCEVISKDFSTNSVT